MTPTCGLVMTHKGSMSGILPRCKSGKDLTLKRGLLRNQNHYKLKFVGFPEVEDPLCLPVATPS